MVAHCLPILGLIVLGTVVAAMPVALGHLFGPRQTARSGAEGSGVVDSGS
jgi:hypothetical protein